MKDIIIAMSVGMSFLSMVFLGIVSMTVSQSVIADHMVYLVGLVILLVVQSLIFFLDEVRDFHNLL